MHTHTRLLTGLVVLLSATSAFAAPVALRNEERIVFYGDSITEQNRYTGDLETFLLSRCPDKSLTFLNYGWSGDTARGGNARFARDVAAAKPSLVIVNFGMNDGGYGGFDQWILDAWLPPQKSLADQIRALGSREVLLTTSVVDPHNDETKWLEGYNDTLAKMAEALKGFGTKESLPVLDLNTPMRSAVTAAKAKDPKTVLVPDGIHPGAAGALIMAWAALKGFDVPAGLGDVTIAKAGVTASPGMRVAHAVTKGPLTTFDLTLPFLPFWIPRESRSILPVIPFEAELNRFRIVAGDLPAGATAWLLVDGRLAGRFTGAELAAGVDAALLDNAAWARQGRRLRDLADRRFDLHFDAWRKQRLGDRAVGEEAATRARLIAAEEETVRALGVLEHAAAQPGTYRVMLSTRPPWSPAFGLPQVIEGFEEPELDGIGAWDESVSIAPATAFVTEGGRAAQMTFDGTRYGWPAMFVDFPAPLDLSLAPKLAVDVYVPSGTIPAGETLTVSLGVKSGKIEYSAAGAKPLQDGAWTTLNFDCAAKIWAAKDKDPKAACPSEHRKKVGAIGITVISAAGKAKGSIYFDNLRAVK